MNILDPVGFARADLHIHTAASDGVMSPRALVDYVDTRTNLDLIAIADHDETHGALAAQTYARNEGKRVEVVVGTEVTTREGHLIGLFVERRIPMLKSLEWTIAAIRDQGGLVVAPHPLSWLTPSVSRARLLALHHAADESWRPDALELVNPTLAGQVGRQAAARLNADQLGYATVGGSDAHFLGHVGAAITRFPGRTAADLRQAILDRTTTPTAGVATGGFSVAELLEQQWRSMVWHPSLKVRRAFFPGWSAP